MTRMASRDRRAINRTRAQSVSPSDDRVSNPSSESEKKLASNSDGPAALQPCRRQAGSRANRERQISICISCGDPGLVAWKPMAPVACHRSFLSLSVSHR